MQKARILHEMQATARELQTVTKRQLKLNRPPDQTPTQEQQNNLSEGLKKITFVLDGLSAIVPVFMEDRFSLAKLRLAIIGTDVVKDRITSIDDELEPRIKKSQN